jgi:FixJ family two-component response regulator
VVVFTANSETPTVIRAMKMGAFDYIEKPPVQDRLLGSIRAALGEDERRRQNRERVEKIMDRIGRLSPEEIAVFDAARMMNAASSTIDERAGAGAIPTAVVPPAADHADDEGDADEQAAEDATPHEDNLAGMPGFPELSSRLRQTLEHLLRGDSEKQAAMHLGLSRHTVHDYVKALYKQFGASSRGELLAACMRVRQELGAAVRDGDTADATGRPPRRRRMTPMPNREVGGSVRKHPDENFLSRDRWPLRLSPRSRRRVAHPHSGSYRASRRANLVPPL